MTTNKRKRSVSDDLTLATVSQSTGDSDWINGSKLAKTVKDEKVTAIDGGADDVEIAETESGKTSKQKKSAISRITLRPTEWSYMSLQISQEFHSSDVAPPAQLDPITAYSIMMQALKRYLGAVGSSFQFDILRINGPEIIVRVPSKQFSRFWASMSTFHYDESNGKQGPFKDVSKVGIEILKSSSFLTGIAAPSRKWTPPTTS